MASRDTIRAEMGLQASDSVLAVLPGSRAGEVAALMPVYADTMGRLAGRHKHLRFLIPAANEARMEQIRSVLRGFDLPVTLTLGSGREVMCASDAVLLASGTATLEAMLLRRPMVIAYRMPWLSWQILSRMAVTPFVGLPNVLAGRQVVPELLQEAAAPEMLAQQVEAVLARGDETQLPIFEELAAQIGGGFAGRAADAIESLIGGRGA